MSVAGELAEFLTRTTPADLPHRAVEHAAMLIASTLASAALGTGLESAKIIRDLARERGGRPDASIWFHPGPKLPMAEAAQVNAVASDAAASDDAGDIELQAVQVRAPGSRQSAWHPDCRCSTARSSGGPHP